MQMAVKYQVNDESKHTANTLVPTVDCIKIHVSRDFERPLFNSALYSITSFFIKA